MSNVKYDACPPVLQNNPWIFVLSILAVAGAIALYSQVPQLLLAVPAVLVLVWLYLFAASRSQRLTITDREIQYVEGLLSKRRAELGLQSVRSVHIDQSFLQRILGIADLEFYSAGDNPEIRVVGMPNPHMIRDLVDNG